MAYKYNIDEKVTIWRRYNMYIEANSKEEADLKAKKILSEESFTEYDSELLYDTEVNMTVDENSGNSTVELFDINNNLIEDNRPLDEKRNDKIDDILK
jgi:hypothetical protein